MRTTVFLMISFTIFFNIFFQKIYGQTNGTLSSKLFYKEAPISFASVLLYATSDSNKVVKNTLSDSLGHFMIEDIHFGNYYLIIRALGFRPNKIEVSFSTAHEEIVLPNILLNIENEPLNNVTVTAQKNLIQRTSQGFIVNASASITQLGGTATDLLRSTPTVLVDAEGVITMRGKSPLILINGRNSSMSNTNQITSSSIESIEIISSPTAQYDADAEGGIINIKLKKGKLSGTNGAVSLGAGFGAKGRINSSFLLNHKTALWNLGIAYDNRFAGRERTIDALRINYDLPNDYQIAQYRNDSRTEALQNLRFNADYTPNKNSAWGFELLFTNEGQDNNEILYSKIITKTNTLKSNTERYSFETQFEKIAETAINYSHKNSNNGALLTANLSSSFNQDRENTSINSQPLDANNVPVGSAYLQKTHNYEDFNVTIFKTDYVFSISEKAKIETGYKGLFRFFESDYQQYDQNNGIFVPNLKASNQFKFDEQVHALYIQFNSFAGNKTSPTWKYDLGLRAEQVYNNGQTISQGISFSNKYFNLFPTANLVYYQSQEQFWKISYSKRINRPGLGQINPFTDITDSLNQHSGNPYLKPELVDALELGFNKEWTKTSFYSALFYRIANNAIRDLIEVLPNGVSIRKPVNYGTGTTYGIENVLTAKPFNLYDLSLSAAFFKQSYSGENVTQDFVSDLFSWNGKLINNFQIWNGGKLQITGVYNSPIATPQGERIANYNVDLGFQQKLGKGNSRIGLVVTDIFNTLQNGTNAQGSNFSAYRISKSDTRAILITFAHSFGSSFKEKLMENKFSIE